MEKVLETEMVVQERMYTTADLRVLEAQQGNEDKRFELINGAIYEVPYPSPTHNLLIGNVYSPLREFAKSHQSGYVFTDSVSYSLPNGDEFAPDVSFVLRDNVTLPLPKAFSITPDMAVEVASPSNRERELLDKAESLLECGTSFVWIVYPTTRVVDICHLSSEGNLITRKVDVDGILDGEGVLPGFTLAVKGSFAL